MPKTCAAHCDRADKLPDVGLFLTQHSLNARPAAGLTEGRFLHKAEIWQYCH